MIEDDLDKELSELEAEIEIIDKQIDIQTNHRDYLSSRKSKRSE